MLPLGRTNVACEPFYGHTIFSRPSLNTRIVLNKWAAFAKAVGKREVELDKRQALPATDGSAEPERTEPAEETENNGDHNDTPKHPSSGASESAAKEGAADNRLKQQEPSSGNVLDVPEYTIHESDLPDLLLSTQTTMTEDGHAAGSSQPVRQAAAGCPATPGSP